MASTSYTFAVQEVSAAGHGDEATIAAPGQAVAPTNLVATAVMGADDEVELSWDNPDNAAIIRYELSRDNLSYATIATSTQGAKTVHRVENLTAGQSYTFYVRAVSAFGEGAPATTTGTPS